MNTTQGQIVDLQVRLNGLVENSSAYTDDMIELYKVSQQLDELIVRYYREYKA
ncbi:aspartyl-phosphate phosphatase Spo0E family protein [Niameybacter massiliensis]|uniref:Aspartyl-phosphate phosphatase Spo0E family protein n=1 Tax=Holtiella tumoricola TaxID=3018743 RepID=A0AA42DPM8_9FIRM|nr:MULTISPECIES: aspartyl-phosphate phosphatase Spo0E family protein [Lachnospirales]MDA3732463.1 aspartyl-phosphate phosphatase Spo0E family protein [Holtiella tumoricola]